MIPSSSISAGIGIKKSNKIIPASNAHSLKATMTPGFTILASSSASQFVRRTQPWLDVLPMREGSGVAAALKPGASLSRVAIEHGINSNLVRKWVLLFPNLQLRV